MTTLPEDRPDWLRHYLDEYWTLEKVGKDVGITREGVRRRLKGMGIERRNVMETSALRDRHTISQRGEEIRKIFLQVRDIAGTARQLSLSDAFVERAVRELVPDFKVLTRVPRNQARNYSTDELIAALRETAESATGILSRNDYDAFLKSHPTLPDGRPRPGRQTITHRFGTWRDALLRAGLPAIPPSGVQKEFDEADAVAAVVECWRQTGGPPTVDGYDRWQRGHPGRYPSIGTTRNRAGTWNPLLLKAWQLVHEVLLGQDDENASIPGPLLSDSSSRSNELFVPYYDANERIEVSVRSDLVASEYNALERAVRSHAVIQNAVAAAAEVVGLQRWSPSAYAPAFDIAVSSGDGHVFVVEVKSATAENLEFQLRIGLGQVLRYAHLLRSYAKGVTPVIAVELQPNESWVELLAELGVGLLVSDSIPSDLACLTGARIGTVEEG